MSTSTVDVRDLKAKSVVISEDNLTVALADGRSISIPLAWYPRLLQGNRTERDNWQLIANGKGIHWPDLDEDLSIESLLLGKRSGESASSFQRWLKGRLA